MDPLNLPHSYPFTHTPAGFREAFDPPAGEGLPDTVRLAGRLRALRRHGRLAFADLSYGGDAVQVILEGDLAGETLLVGDWIGVEGNPSRTRRGELSLRASSLSLLSRPRGGMPDMHSGVADPELRRRHRELDLLANPEARRPFLARAAVLSALRSELASQDYLEVETPVLHPVAGGAAAEPFLTRHEASAGDRYLRIAPELYLRRLVVGGLPRVYEVARCFRNEGTDSTHNPEFTLLEAYRSMEDWTSMLDLAEGLISAAAAACGAAGVLDPGFPLPPYRRARMDELVSEALGAPVGMATGPEEMADLLRGAGVDAGTVADTGGLLALAYDRLVEPGLAEPVFVTHFPAAVSPLARRCPEEPGLCERFELLVGGMELANAYSEQNDAAEQRARMEEQATLGGGRTLDEDYLFAAGLGLPPTAGLGLGVDRLVMLLAGIASIRDAVAFPDMGRRD